MTLLLLTLLTQVQFPTPPTEASWEAAKCVHLSNGVVHCDEVAFTALTDSLGEAEASVERLQLQLSARDAQLEALKAALLAVPAPVAPTPVQAQRVKPLLAVVSAVLGTMAISAAALDDKLSPGARVGLGITGTAAVTGSLVIIF